MTARTFGPAATRAAFPLGGIGTGNVSIGARGEFRDWELANRPGKGRHNPFTFFAIRVAGDGAPAITRVLEAQLAPPHDSDQGYRPGDLAGLPRLADSRMRGTYPMLEIDFIEDALPVNLSLRAYTPFVPLDAADSGIPCAVISYRVSNPGQQSVSVSIAGSIGNPVGVAHLPDLYRNHPVEVPQGIEWRDDGAVRGIWMTADTAMDDLRHGSCALVTADSAVSSKPRWLTGEWNDGAQSFWDEFSAVGTLTTEALDSHDETSNGARQLLVGSLAIEHAIGPGESRDFEFLLSWHFPNRPRGWDGNVIHDDPHLDEVVRNDYASRYDDAWTVARDVAGRRLELETTTEAFTRALHDSALPESILDAVSSNLAVIRSTTCFVLEGGVFAAWEGSLDYVGSCEGTCTHVWNYAQSLAWLFPSLERSARRTEFLLETRADGRQNFRTNRIFGSPPWDFHPAVDGQLGSVLRVYREWLLSGDDGFLDEVWPGVCRALDYAFAEWDTNGDLVLDSRQHNTYDIEFYGENSLGNSMFYAALRAAAELAAHRGERERADHWREAAEVGADRMDALLFNGEYYQQNLDDVDERRYQYGTGVLSDQLFGQLLSHLVGLGYLLPVAHVRSALASVFTHNFRRDLGAHVSVQRAFALNHEAGLVLCSWPRGGRPQFPFVYADETWAGVEYQVAAHLIYEGMADEAIQVVDAVRGRHDGLARNPWNEIEFGNHYARSLASWALLLATTGQQYNAYAQELRFAPSRPGGYFFSTSSAWGTVELADGDLTLQVLGGELRVRRVLLHDHLLVRHGPPSDTVSNGAAVHYSRHPSTEILEHP